MKPIEFYNETWRVKFYVFLGCKWDFFANYCKKNFNLDVVSCNNVGYATFTHEGIAIMWIKDKKDTGVLAHESLHLTNFVLEYAGVQPSYVNDESQAYLLTYIIDKSLAGRK